MSLRVRFATSLAALLTLLAPMHEAPALQTPTPAPCTPTFRFAASSYSVTEVQGVVTLTVQRECIGQSVSVGYASSSSNCTATPGSDYTAVSGTLYFGAEDTSKTIDVPILDDTIAENDETFTVSLSGTGITYPYSTTVTITDGVPAVSISASPTSGLESDEPTAKFTVSLSTAPSSTVTVPITLGGTATRYGTNLITDPSLESPTDRWWLNSENNKGAFTRAGEGAFFGSSSAKFSATTMDGWMIPSYKLDLDIPSGGLVIQPYTLSFYARAEATRTLWAHIAGINGLDLMADLGNVTITPTWKRYTLTFTPLHNGGASGNHYPNLRFSAFADDLPLTLYIDGLKLEPGSSATKFGDYEFFGKNLISNSDLESAATNWYLNSGGGDPAFSRVNTAAYSGSYSAKYSATTFGDWLIPTYLLWSDIHPDGLSTTDQYALSYYAKMDAARTLTGTIGNGNGTGALAYFGEVEFGTTWKRYEYFFTPANNGAAPNYPGIKLEALGNDVPFTLYWDKLQLQKVSPLTSVTFAAGETVQILEMPVINDKIYEDNETITVTLGTPVGADLASPSTASFTINEDDEKPLASLQGLPTTAPETDGEEPTWVPIGVSLNHGNTEKSIQVPLSYGGTGSRSVDYTAPLQADLSAGTQSTTVYAVTIDDTVDEPDETIDVTIGSSETVSPGSPSTGTVTLEDDDPSPVVRFTSSTAAVSEGAEELEVTAELTFASQRTLTISYATADDTTSAGDDYTAVAGTLTFAPGVTSQSFSIPLTIDCVEEDTEYFSVALSAPGNLSVGSPGTQVITLLDEGDCTPSEVTFTSPVMVLSESGTWNIPVERRGGSQGRLSVSIQPTYYSAISPEDFTLAETTLVWENGEAGIKEVPVSIIPDTTQEVDERFFLRIEDVTAQAMPEVGPLSWMGLIIRDDDTGGLGTRRYEPAGWGDDDPVAGDDPAGAGDRRPAPVAGFDADMERSAPPQRELHTLALRRLHRLDEHQ
jgi:hypothetical protein